MRAPEANGDPCHVTTHLSSSGGDVDVRICERGANAVTSGLMMNYGLENAASFGLL